MTSPATSGVIYSRLIVEALTRYPDRDAFIAGERRVTYAEAADKAGRYAAQLRDYGIGPGTGVAALSPNIPEVWLAQAAALTLGGHFTGLHLMGSLEDHAFVCQDSGAAVLLVAERYVEHAHAIAAKAPAVKHIVVLHEDDAPDEASRSELSVGAVTEDTVALLQYTGGTTGRPKGVMLPQRALAHQAFSIMGAWGLPETPVYLAASPITHVAVVPVVPTLILGGTVVLLPSFDPQSWFDAVEKHRVNYAFAVPTMLYALLDAKLPREYDTSSLETVVYGASPMSPARLTEAKTRFGEVFLQIYGQSENSAIATVLRRDEHDPDLLASCGRAVDGTDVAVLDADGNEVPVGEVGELCVRSPAVMLGYRNLPAESAAALRGGWLHSGDMACKDERGFYYIVDRKKDLIISGGFNVYPREVEDALGTHPAVAASAVIGVPDPKWGEAVKAIVVLRPGETVEAAQLIAHVKARKGSVCAPKSVDFAATLPMTPIGKIDKKALRAPHWATKTRQVN